EAPRASKGGPSIICISGSGQRGEYLGTEASKAVLRVAGGRWWVADSRNCYAGRPAGALLGTASMASGSLASASFDTATGCHDFFEPVSMMHWFALVQATTW